MRKQFSRLASGMAVVIAVSCGGGDGGTGPQTGGNNNPGGNTGGGAGLTANVSMYQSAFAPGTVTIKAGGTVTWKNDDGIAHTATGNGFDTGTMQGGQEVSKTFAAVGTYAYHCTFHSGMTGTVSVVAN